jgi:hypothetical protein
MHVLVLCVCVRAGICVVRICADVHWCVCVYECVHACVLCACMCVVCVYVCVYVHVSCVHSVHRMSVW